MHYFPCNDGITSPFYYILAIDEIYLLILILKDRWIVICSGGRKLRWGTIGLGLGGFEDILRSLKRLQEFGVFDFGRWDEREWRVSEWLI